MALVKIIGQQVPRHLIQAIIQEQRTRVIDNFARRIKQSFQLNGGNLEHVIEGFLPTLSY